MRYLSTRGGVTPVSFSQAVMMGLATDGGLLLPERIPAVDAATLAAWARLPFASLALEVVGRFVAEEDIPRADLARLVERSYSTFTHPEVTPVVDVDGLRILELFHGPTLAFKDVALQLLGNLFEYLLARDGGHLNILGATSGDTGSAAIYGVRGKRGIDIFILHPHNRVSPVQEKQMTTVLDANVHNVAIDGTFDDAQRIVKALFGDLGFKDAYRLGAVNSINWARIAAQIVYYFHAWVTGQPRRPGPAGAASPCPPATSATSSPGTSRGDGSARRTPDPRDQRERHPRALLQQRRLRVGPGLRHGQPGHGHPGVVSNFERYLFYLMDGDAGAVQALMDGFARTGRLVVDAEKHRQARADFASTAVGEEQTVATIREVYERTGYILDPHTAVGVAAARAVGAADAICLATAHPAKFREAVTGAIGHSVPLPAPFEDLLERESRMAVLPADADAIRSYMIETLRH